MSGRAEERVHLGVAVLVGAIGGAVGFKHSHDWAVENGQEEWIAWAVAVVIECMAIVAGLELKRRRAGFPLLVLVGAFLLQMSAQVANARPTLAGWIIAATPALGFLCIVKMLLTRLSEQPEVQTPAEPLPVELPAEQPRPVPAEAVRVEAPVAELPAPTPPPVQAAVTPAAAVWPPSAA